MLSKPAEKLWPQLRFQEGFYKIKKHTLSQQKHRNGTHICETYTTTINLAKLATLVERDPKASFYIATTSMCRRGHYSIPWIAPLYPWSIPYNVEC